ncbi:ABC transporter permease [uncultured Alistipes sp.]|uniref:ABC transporter permease n=1 Tax=uncultured Alistipes sp. TaxID=538949 RepID=UPI00262B4608|nr:ABC transporter permease [uncultured Alistipes sp.]
MRELFQEILASAGRNKLRTFLTGFSVAWGIFMLIVLLGSGNGLKNGVTSNFSDRAKNSMATYGGWTSVPYKGYQKGRTIYQKGGDTAALRRTFPQIRKIAAHAGHPGSELSYGKNYTKATLNGVSPEYAEIEGVKLLEGRFINAADVREGRKVIVIDETAAAALFGGRSGIGTEIIVDKMVYTIVGLCKVRSWGNNATCYLPLSTVQQIYLSDNENIGQIVFTLEGIEDEKQSEAFEKELREYMAARHTFSPEDRSAYYIWDRLRNYMQTMMIFNGISMFIWIIGIGTLTAGIVGVSNIMLVTVRERTAEFGIRKALGARPSSVVRLILVEAIVITAFFGYVGMVAGVGLMELVNFFMERSAAAAPSDSFSTFKNPTLDLSVVVTATVVLIVSGVIAGYVPARRAARLKTIDALRFNK